MNGLGSVGEMIDSVRYWLALLVVVSFPGAIGVWLLIHEFIAYWRKVGPAITYGLVLLWMVASWVAMFLIREPLLRIEFGTRWSMLLVGALLYSVAGGIELRCWKHLSFKTVVGIPEVVPQAGGDLMRKGIYGRVRHPRYLGWTIGLFAFACLTNYLTMYVLAVLFVPAIYLVTLLEERELRDRFGTAYEVYQARVPRLVPRFGKENHREVA